jgi:hypothetical protein
MKKSTKPSPTEVRALMTGIGQENAAMQVNGVGRMMRVCDAIDSNKQAAAAPPEIKECRSVRLSLGMTDFSTGPSTRSAIQRARL